MQRQIQTPSPKPGALKSPAGFKTGDLDSYLHKASGPASTLSLTSSSRPYSRAWTPADKDQISSEELVFTEGWFGAGCCEFSKLGCFRQFVQGDSIIPP